MSQVIVTSSKFYKQWFNGVGYSVDLTNNVNNLAGLVFQKIKLIQSFKIEWSSATIAAQNAAANMQWSAAASGNELTILRADGGSFLADGFWLGDVVNARNKQESTGTPQHYDGGSIISVTADLIIIDFGVPIAAVQSLIFWWYITGVSPLTALEYKYGLIENSEQFSTKSIINGENQGWYSLGTIGEDILGVRQTNWVAMEGLGVPNSWENGSCQIKYVSTIDEDQRVWQTFQIEHIFIIPYFVPPDITDLENNILPDYLDGLNSLKYVFQSDFRTFLSDPNTGKISKIENILGSVGWFGESFNGFDSNYIITSISYEDNATGNSADGVQVGAKTKVTAVIGKLIGNFNANDFIGVYFSYLPEDPADVKNTATTFEENFMYDSIFTEIGVGAVVGAGVLDAITGISVGPNNVLTIEFTTDLTAAQQLIALENKFLLGFEVGDRSIVAANSDCVMLKETGVFDSSSDIQGLITFSSLIYPYSEDFATSIGVTNFRGWNEHGLGIKGDFILDLTKSAFLNSFEISLIAYKIADGTSFEIDNFEFQFPNTLITTGGFTSQVLDMATTRGYPLLAGSEKNVCKIVTDTSTLGTNAPKYNFEFSQKISWEDWIENADVNTIFLDFTKPNDNLNDKASNYYNVAKGYDIRLAYKFNISGIGTLGQEGATEYKFLTPPFIINDYDNDSFSPPTFVAVLETFDESGVINLGGAILIGDNTLFKITWTWSGGALFGIGDFWGIHRIEESGQTSKQLRELGTDDLPPSNNIMKPITGSYLTISVVGGALVTSCLIDGSQIISGINYNLSGEIGSPRIASKKIEAKILEDGTFKTLENGVLKVKKLI